MLSESVNTERLMRRLFNIQACGNSKMAAINRK